MIILFNFNVQKVLKGYFKTFFFLSLLLGFLPLFFSASSANSASITYSAYCRGFGWQNSVGAGTMAGTVGRSIPVDALRINLEVRNVEIRAEAHASGAGWLGVVTGKNITLGAEGMQRQLEAIKLSLSSNSEYDISYRVHVSGTGWMDWVQNGEVAGTTGKGKAIEAVEIKLERKGSIVAEHPTYSAFCRGFGWQEWVKAGAMAGTVGRSLPVDALRINVGLNNMEIAGEAHVASVGWTGTVKGKNITLGAEGMQRQMEAVKLSLNSHSEYDITYRVHVSGIGWMNWVKNGEVAGTTGQGKAVEAIEIKFIRHSPVGPGPKPNPIPGPDPLL